MKQRDIKTKEAYRIPKDKQTSRAGIGRSGRRALAAMGRQSPARSGTGAVPAGRPLGNMPKSVLPGLRKLPAEEAVYQGTRLARLRGG